MSSVRAELGRLMEDWERSNETAALQAQEEIQESKHRVTQVC